MLQKSCHSPGNVNGHCVGACAWWDDVNPGGIIWLISQSVSAIAGTTRGPRMKESSLCVDIVVPVGLTTSLVVSATMCDVRRSRRATVWHRVIHSIGALHGIFNDNFKLKVRTH